jgi:hypothetical protein
MYQSCSLIMISIVLSSSRPTRLCALLALQSALSVHYIHYYNRPLTTAAVTILDQWKLVDVDKYTKSPLILIVRPSQGEFNVQSLVMQCSHSMEYVFRTSNMMRMRLRFSSPLTSSHSVIAIARNTLIDIWTLNNDGVRLSVECYFLVSLYLFSR